MTARRLAVECLIETEKGGYSNLVFKRRAELAALSMKDTSFAAALFYGTLERQITLDYILSNYLKRSIDKLDAEIRAILRSGAFQLHYMGGVATFAAVNESVKLAKEMKKRSAAPMVNAVLRKTAAFDLRHLLDGLQGVKTLSVAYSLNEPLSQLLLAQYGEQAEEIMQGFFVRTKQAVRVNTLRLTTEQAVGELNKEGIVAEPGTIDGSLVVSEGNVLHSKLLETGDIRIQSLAAQAAVFALSPEQGKKMLDLCAAPGGKTLTAAQRMRNEGEVIAFDKHKNRLKLIEEQATREGISIVETTVADSSAEMEEYSEKFDFVLCDVPCSGYGEINSKPELRLRAPRVDESLENIQYAILENGASYLKEDGRLVYSTCTIDKRENEGVCKRFLAEHPDFCAIRANFPETFRREENGFYLQLPSLRDGEGFFAAVFERKREIEAES